MPSTCGCSKGSRTAADGYREAEAAFAAEDREWTAALRSNARDGGDPPAEDRTPAAERDARLAALLERVEASVIVLAEHVDRVVTVLRRREDELLGALTAELAPAAAKRGQAERLVAGATRAEWTLYAAAKWLKATADDLSFARQPSPSGHEPPPPGWSGRVAPDDLARPWHERREWNAGYEPPEDMASWQGDDAPEDGTGDVPDLVERDEAAA